MMNDWPAIERPAGADDGVASASDRAEELEQACLARSVDRPRAHDCHLEAVPPMEFERRALPFHFRLLIDVTGREGRLLVRGRMRDVAVHADGRGMDETFHPGRSRRLGQPPRPADVHVAVIRVGMAGRAVDGGHVDDRSDAFDQPPERVRVRQVAFDDMRSRGGDLRRRHGTRQGDHLVAAGAERREHVAAGITRGPREGDPQTVPRMRPRSPSA
jgi:hypothetical protein